MGFNVGIILVIGFLLGVMFINCKVYEVVEVIKVGVDEIDMVINIGKLKDKDYDYVFKDIMVVKYVCGDYVLKVIVEIVFLIKEEIEKVIEIVM